MNEGFDRSRILHEDENCVVVDKRIGEAMEGAKSGVEDLGAILAKALGVRKNAAGKDFPPTAVHRLDVPVSGCALFARNPAALAFLSTVFAEGRARKTYWAIVEPPRPGEAEGEAPVEGKTVELVHWLSVDAQTNKSHVHDEEGPDRKRAVLRYRVVGRGDRYLFLEIELVTGRHHQIRAQLAAVGLRIKGDLKYGARRSEKGGGIRLHARSLAFPDFARPEAFVQTVAKVPADDALWAAFEAAAAGGAGTS
jgi:23S rRNA pseudouridine1911/1915/1917 synthase